MEIPADNQLTDARIALGRKLFFDPALSADNSISCASCHKPSLAFADTARFSLGVNGNRAFRNTPTLLNVGFKKELFADGTVPALEFQVFSPLADSNEMHQAPGAVVDKLRKDPAYNALAREAYNRDFDVLVLSFALAAYQRSLVSAGSRYDEVMAGKAKFTETEKQGQAIFQQHCSSCHSGLLFTDQKFHNIGTGTPGDKGRSRLTYRKADEGRFKTIPLRNVGVTAPYLHDGSAAGLSGAVKAHQPADSAGMSLYLSETEMTALVYFLKTLTDNEFADK